MLRECANDRRCPSHRPNDSEHRLNGTGMSRMWGAYHRPQKRNPVDLRQRGSRVITAAAAMHAEEGRSIRRKWEGSGRGHAEGKKKHGGWLTIEGRRSPRRRILLAGLSKMIIPLTWRQKVSSGKYKIHRSCSLAMNHKNISHARSCIYTL